MNAHERATVQTGEDSGAIVPATENAEMALNQEHVSSGGDTDAMRRAVAAENARTPESGGVAEQEAYLSDTRHNLPASEYERRAEQADINNDVNDQHKNERTTDGRAHT